MIVVRVGVGETPETARVRVGVEVCVGVGETPETARVRVGVEVRVGVGVEVFPETIPDR